MGSFTEKINVRLILIVFFSIFLCTGGLVYYVNTATKNLVVENETRSMKTIGDGIALALSNTLESARALATTLAAQHAVIQILSGDDSSKPSLEYEYNSLISSDVTYSGIIVSSLDGKPLLAVSTANTHFSDIDVKNASWFTTARNQNREVISSSLLFMDSKKSALLPISAPISDESGKQLGILTIFLDWNSFTSRFLDSVRVAGAGYGYILDKEGNVIGHAVDKNLIRKSVASFEFVQKALSMKNGVLEYDWKGKKKIMSMSYVPATGYIVSMTAFDDELSASATKGQGVIIGAGMIMALLVCTIIIFFVRTFIIKPLNTIVHFTQQIASGDFGTTLENTFICELSVLAQNIIYMVDEIKNKLGFAQGVLNGIPVPCGIIGPDFNIVWANESIADFLEKPKSAQEYIGQSSGEFYYNDPSRETLSDKAIKERKQLSAELEYTTPSGIVKHVAVTTTPFYDLDDELLGSISFWLDVSEIRKGQLKSEKQRQSVEAAAVRADDVARRLSVAADELNAQIDEANNGSQVQRDRVSETATAMEQMNATVLEVARNAGQAAQGVMDAKDKAFEGDETVNRMTTSIVQIHHGATQLQTSMEELGHKAESIGSVLGVIRDIADQTNLLALNAAIEAARAGETGRGFAVVADEVRKLAEKTMEATKQVNEAIADIQTSARENVEATEQSVEAIVATTSLADASRSLLSEIVEMVQSAADQVHSIAAASEEQSSASEQINASTEEINRIATESSLIMQESTKAVQDVAELAMELGIITHDMTHSNETHTMKSLPSSHKNAR
ncbi:methyl-accepting chemotaxis protein [Desulfovibrio inopinatus]|uniref:methyl-accepting chemotaxis protein n=1 Tax=Desulfovibrio inopinatus TaxID=102109 RepID=UPI000401F6A0|nr:methyl-accepting chemotaxis protein [Desulfovibrio inopinatus]